MSTDDKRLIILTEDELIALYERPHLQEEERQAFFSLNLIEQAAMAHLNVNSRIYCILQLGYFKARQQFYRLEFLEIQADLDGLVSGYMQNPATL